jgi:pyruvate kinase
MHIFFTYVFIFYIKYVITSIAYILFYIYFRIILSFVQSKIYMRNIYQMERFTKILATVGPAVDSKEKIMELVKAGANAFRLNFSHGEHDEHAQRVLWIREIEAELGQPISILQDLQGPKIRVGKFDKAHLLKVGDIFTFDNKEELGDATRVQLPHTEILETLDVNDPIFVNDGVIQMKVIEKGEGFIKCEVTASGEISDRKGMNLPGVDLPVTAMTDKDHRDIRYTLDTDLEVDWIALSFVQRPSDIVELREIIGDKYKIMAKIEMPQAVDRIEEILPVVDGIMVARGDLGVEVPFAKVPLIQKSLIKQAQDMGKTVVVATQMLDSMVRNPSPTRAEASDIANAVFDGTDAVMLSNESAAGDHPVKAVEAMASIAAFANQAPYFMRNQDYYYAESANDEMATEDAISSSAAMIAEQLESAAIVCYTATGSTARRMSRQRPTTKIWALTPNAKAARALSLNYGVSAKVVDEVTSVDALIPFATDKAKEFGAAKEGEKIVITFGSPIGQLGSTNTIKVATV